MYYSVNKALLTPLKDKMSVFYKVLPVRYIYFYIGIY
jgi:hypothetical protein